MSLTEQNYKKAFQDKDPSPTVLIVDDCEGDQLRLKYILEKSEGSGELNILRASSVMEAEKILSHTPVHVILLDKNLGENEEDPKQNGIKSIPSFLRIQPHLGILVITGNGSFDDVKEAMSFGAFDFAGKNETNERLLLKVDRTIKYAKALKTNSQRERSISTDSVELGGTSKVFKQILAQTQILAETERPILLLGESGTGKSAIAKWINQCREKFLAQSKRPFFALNIATLSPDVVESELFGHEKGSFTSAEKVRQGFFELAHNGTLFLDEIGEASLDLQAKLLTVIENGEFFRMGGSTKMKTSAKLVFATNRNLEAMVKQGTFRLDLYMRINSFPVEMPSLEDRREDIPDIVRALLPRLSKENGVKATFEDVPKDFIEHLMTTKLEGNIRGIIHQLDRLLVLSPKDMNHKPIFSQWRSISGLASKSSKNIRIQTETKPITFDEIKKRSFDVIDPSFPGIKEFISLVKSKIVQEACEKNNGELKKAAEALKVAASYIYPLAKRSHLDSARPEIDLDSPVVEAGRLQ